MFDYACALVIYEMCVQEPTATVSDNENFHAYCHFQGSYCINRFIIFFVLGVI